MSEMTDALLFDMHKSERPSGENREAGASPAQSRLR